MKETTWLCDAIPGGVVRAESTTETAGGTKTTSVTETVAFEKKKK